MFRPFSLALGLAVALGSSGAAAGHGSPVEAGGGAPDEPCPHEIASTGTYRNRDYGFSIVIPPGLNGYWNAAVCAKTSEGCVCLGDHGRVLPLAPESHGSGRYIEVYAGFDIEDRAEQVRSRVDRIQERGRQNSLVDISRRALRLAGLRAQRIAVRYYDKKLDRGMAENFVQAKRSSLEYSLYVRTPVETYQRDRKTLEEVVRSFTLLKPQM